VFDLLRVTIRREALMLVFACCRYLLLLLMLFPYVNVRSKRHSNASLNNQELN
jgi:hypothetical protein